jgi:two-component system chemotaxis response regulator CheB
MGSDGAKGMKVMKSAGAKTIGQDESSSVVYGMPKVAFDIGAIDYQLHIDNISDKLISLVSESRKN